MPRLTKDDRKIKESRYNSALKYVKAILRNANSKDDDSFVGQRLATFDQVYDDHLSAFGYNLRKIRLLRGFSTRDLGMLTGLGTGKIAKLENGKEGFANSTLVKLGDSLDCYAVVVFVDKETVHEALQRKPPPRTPRMFEDEDGSLKYSKTKTK